LLFAERRQLSNCCLHLVICSALSCDFFCMTQTHKRCCNALPSLGIPDLEQMTTLSPLRTKFVARAFPIPTMDWKIQIVLMTFCWNEAHKASEPFVLPVMTTLNGATMSFPLERATVNTLRCFTATVSKVYVDFLQLRSSVLAMEAHLHETCSALF